MTDMKISTPLFFAFALYVSVAAAAWKSYGCYDDDAADRALRTDSADAAATTADACVDACWDHSRKYFSGVVNGVCRCDNDLANAKKHGTATCVFQLYGRIEDGWDQGGISGFSGIYPSKYNLIDADPSCRYDAPSFGISADTSNGEGFAPQCPDMFSGPGDVDVTAILPNWLERYYFLMENAQRMHPDETAAYYGQDARCTEDPAPAADFPFYFLSQASQAARWNRWTRATPTSDCDPSTECDAGFSAHYTCCEYCDRNVWGQCQPAYQLKGFQQQLFMDNSYNRMGSANGGGGHCNVILNPAYNHQGYGWFPDCGGIERWSVDGTFTWEDHVLPHGVHNVESDGSLTFIVQWFGGKVCGGAASDTPLEASAVYVLYGGAKQAMALKVGNAVSGFYEFSVGTAPSSCEPYAFVVQDTQGGWHRLPEEGSYYFSTVSSLGDILDTANTDACAENHYYFTGTDWVANGAPFLTNAKTAASGNCEGCSSVAALVAEEPASWVDYANYAMCPTPSPTSSPTKTPVETRLDCASNWVPMLDSGGNAIPGQFYNFEIAHIESSCSWITKTWADAVAHCQASPYFGELVSFSSEDEYQAIGAKIGGNMMWIGLAGDGSNLLWDDGTQCMEQTNQCLPASWFNSWSASTSKKMTLTGSYLPAAALRHSWKGNKKRFLCKVPAGPVGGSSAQAPPGMHAIDTENDMHAAEESSIVTLISYARWILALLAAILVLNVLCWIYSQCAVDISIRSKRRKQYDMVEADGDASDVDADPEKKGAGN